MVTAALDSWLLQLRRSQGLRRAIRKALGRHTASRGLAGTPFRVAFPAGQHLNLFFAARVRYEAAITRHLGSLVPRGGVAFHALRAAHALAMWCLILGVTGLFLRYLSGHSALRRYLCDSSYFLYIAHLPVIMLFQLILLGVPPGPGSHVPL